MTSRHKESRRTQLDEIPDSAHDEEPDADGLANLNKLTAVRWRKRAKLVQFWV